MEYHSFTGRVCGVISLRNPPANGAGLSRNFSPLKLLYLRVPMLELRNQVYGKNLVSGLLGIIDILKRLCLLNSVTRLPPGNEGKIRNCGEDCIRFMVTVGIGDGWRFWAEFAVD